MTSKVRDSLGMALKPVPKYAVMHPLVVAIVVVIIDAIRCIPTACLGAAPHAARRYRISSCVHPTYASCSYGRVYRFTGVNFVRIIQLQLNPLLMRTLILEEIAYFHVHIESTCVRHRVEI